MAVGDRKLLCVIRSAGKSVASGGVTTPLDFTEALFDPHGMWSAGAPSRITFQADASPVLVFFNLAYAVHSGGSRRIAGMSLSGNALDGSGLFSQCPPDATGSYASVISAHGFISPNASQYLQIGYSGDSSFLFQDSGASLAVTATVYVFSFHGLDV